MNSKYPRQNSYQNKIHIVKNKEIIIYTNGEESNRYHYSEVVEIPSEEAQPAVEHIQKKYSNFEVENKNTKFDPQKIDFDLESNEDFNFGRIELYLTFLGFFNTLQSIPITIPLCSSA